MSYELRYDSNTGKMVGPPPEMVALLESIKSQQNAARQVPAPAPVAPGRQPYRHQAPPRQPAAYPTHNPYSYPYAHPTQPVPSRNAATIDNNREWERVSFWEGAALTSLVASAGCLLTGVVKIGNAVNESVTDVTLGNPEVTSGMIWGASGTALSIGALLLSGASAIASRIRGS